MKRQTVRERLSEHGVFCKRHLIVFALATMAFGTASSAEEFTTFKGHGGPIMALDVSPSGQVASASFDNSVGIWPGPTWLEGHDAAVTALNFELGPLLFSGGDDFRVLMWNGGVATQIAQHKGKIAGIAVSPNKQAVVTASWDGSLKQTSFDAPLSDEHDAKVAKVEELLGHRSNVTDVAFAPNGGLFSTSSDGTLRVWERIDGAPTSRILVNQGFGINRLYATNDWIAYGAVDGATRVIDPNGAEIADFTLDRRPILSMDYSVATKQLAVGDGHGYIMLIDTERWRITRDFRAMRNGPVWALAFSNDGKTIHAGGIDDVVYAWPVALLDQYDPVNNQTRTFLRNANSMPNGERQFMRKCSICHALAPGPSRKAGPTLHGVFGRPAGIVDGYRYSDTLYGSDIIWSDASIDALFDEGPDTYIPGSKMPMQVIAKPSDRADLIEYLKQATKTEDKE